ncbi:MULTISPECIES: efflux RND transporter periplasmic adaptor subunit [unclassified Spirosoma]|jgi:cobalt-zinc-cadmium efflux system membrane fusion protein|uniref:efflux RND transporter periplasmic adaptor subunit n=1 Tax=unclassified Spirosoma TaxID=2621999 RepID=UPI00095D848D|nr:MULTISPECIES: efflux RND transporter periplasmic adaptor subunit [unclassified Spirosoma]MBN8820465.1 efflux RND transporter periplasmic adaptor subunit [Spirosoma sp.]OJW72905.1 MAG: hypothetical protein BGO59_09165 [Spirosoma sp. 48-14]
MNHPSFNWRLWLALFILLSSQTACQQGDKSPQSRETAAPTKTGESTESTEEAGTVELTETQFQTAGIRLGPLETRTLSNLIRVNGALSAPPQQQVSVSTPYGGILVSASLLPGTLVRKGQVLAVLENPEFIRLQQDYLETSSRLTFQQQEYERQRELSQQNVGALKTLQQATAELGSLRARTEGLRQQLALLGIPLSELKGGKISRTVTMRAPIDGTVTVAGVNRGRYVAANDVLFEIVDASRLLAQLTVFEGDVAQVQVGQRVRLSLVGQTGASIPREYTGRIRLINRETNTDRTVSVYASFDHAPAGLRPGTFLKAVIETTSQPVPALPEGAIVQSGNQSQIFVLEEKEGQGEGARYRFRAIPVRIGVTENGYQAVTLPPDLKPGNRIVMAGAYDLLSAMNNTEEEEGK